MSAFTPFSQSLKDHPKAHRPKMRTVRGLGAALIVSGLALSSPAEESMPASDSLPLIMNSIVDPSAMNFENGKYGTAINGQTFQQEALVSSHGYQYAAYFADGGVLCVARRDLDNAEWEVIRFNDYKINHQDVHNVAVIGISEQDGTIHLAFDHHVNHLHYRRSVAGLALEPEKFEWDAILFGSVTSELEPGKPITEVTYLMFFPAPEGKLQLLYRTGSSGNGDWHLTEYAEGGWKPLGVLFSGDGRYENSNSRCAYPNPVRYGKDGRLHVTWCWRERPSGGPFDLRTNHDVCYAYSDDHGRTWKNSDGVIVAALEPGESGKAIGVESPGIIVAKTKFVWGQMNTTTQYVDEAGRVHVVNWQNPADASAATTDLNQWRYFHYWNDASGEWHEQRLPFFGRKPQMVVSDRGHALVIFTKGRNLNYHGSDGGGTLTIAAASEETGWEDWKVVWQSDAEFVGEPLLDLGRWVDDGILSIYAQQKPAAPGEASPLRVLEFQGPEKAQPTVEP